MRPSPGAVVTALLAFALMVHCAAATLAAPLEGRRVSDVLRELSGPSLRFVFSSSLVPDSLRVLQEPRGNVGSADPLELAREILAPHRLTLQSLQSGLYAVVAVPQPTATARAASEALPVDTEPLREVVVATSRYRIGAPAATLLQLDRADLTEQPGIGDDPVRTLARIPGITQDGLSAQANVRGGETNEVLMLLDGFPLRRAFHLSGYQSLFSVIDSNIIRSADVFTGGFPARYGNRMAGVFDFHTVNSVDEPRHSLSIDFFNASGRTSGEWHDTEYLASGRVGTLSPLLNAFAPRVGDPRYSDAFLRLEHGDPDSLRLSGNLLWARNELTITDPDSGESARFEDRLQYLWGRADRNFGPDLSASVWLGQSTLQSFRSGEVHETGIATGSVRDRRTSTIWDLRSRVQWQLREHQVIETGLEFTQEDARYEYAANASYSPAVQQLFGIGATLQRVADLSPQRRRSAVFVSHRWQILPSLTTEIGMRAQAVVSTGLEADWSGEPRIGVRWQLLPRTRLNIAWGRFYQADEVHELKIEDGLDNFPAPQRSDHFIAGLEHEPTPQISLRGEFFSKRQTDPRARYENLLDRRTVLPEIAPDRVRVLPDSAELEGVELSAEYHAAQWRGWLSTSWSTAVDETNGRSTPRSWDESWAVSGGVRWERGPWMASGALIAHRGFPTTALLENGVAMLGVRNGTRLPTFAQLDLRVRFTQPLAVGSLAYSLELLNATDHQNPCCTELQLGATGLQTRRLRGLPLVPSLGVRWNW